MTAATDAVTRPSHRRPESRTALGMLIALTAIAPVSTDMFLPSMPQMAEDFNTTTGAVSLAVTLFLLAFAGSQLVYGPASDRWGRRPVLLAGLGVYIAGGLVALFAVSVETLVAGRVLQGLGGGAGPSIATAIVIDVYRREGALKAMAAMTVVTALAPMLAPIAGGFLHDAFGWRAVFVTLTAVGCLLAAGYLLLLPETNSQKDAKALNARAMLANYTTLWTTPIFAGHALLMALMFSGQLVFISSSSFVLVDDLGLSARLYGLTFGFVALGIMVGANVSRRLAGHWTPRRIVVTAAAVGSLSSSTMAALALLGFEGVGFIVAPMMVIAGVMGMSGPAARSSALTPFPQMAGLASALMGFTQIGVAASYSIGYNTLLEPGPVTMTCAIAVASFGAFVAAGLFAGGRQRST